MQGIKNMLLGIAIMLAVVIFHLFYGYPTLTAIISAIVGMILVIAGYRAKDTDSTESEE